MFSDRLLPRLAATLLASLIFVSAFMPLSLANDSEWEAIKLDQAVHALEFQDKWLFAASDCRLIRVNTSDVVARQWTEFSDIKIQHMRLTNNSVYLAGAYRVEYGFVAKLRIEGLFTTKQNDETLPSDEIQRHPLDAVADWCILDLPTPVTCLSLADSSVIVGDRTGRLRRLSQSDGAITWNEPIHPKLVTCVTSLNTPNAGQLIASGDWGGKIVITALDDGRVVHSFSLHRDTITDLIPASSTLSRLYSCSRDGTARLWYVDQHRLVRFHRETSPLVSIASWTDDVIVAANRNADLLWIDMSSTDVTETLQCPIDYIHALATSSPRLAISNGRDTIVLRK